MTRAEAVPQMTPAPTITVDAQPSVRRSVLVARVVGAGAWLLGLLVFLNAWAMHSEIWLIGFSVIYTVLVGVVFHVAGMPLLHQQDADARWARQLHELAVRDELTGLYNRRFFNVELQRSVEAAQAGKEPLSLALIDLNDFKHVNDRFGHQAGDLALQVAAECIRAAAGQAATVARTGGDEFAIILPGTTVEEANDVLAGLRQTLATTPLLFQGSRPGTTRLRAAAGAVEARPGATAERLLIDADLALYRDKDDAALAYDAIDRGAVYRPRYRAS